MKKFRLTAEAAADLSEIFDYIAAENIDAAQRVCGEIYHQMKQLAMNPGRGHKREDLTSRDLRFWPIYPILSYTSPRAIQ